jgi:hypothetical protein
VRKEHAVLRWNFLQLVEAFTQCKDLQLDPQTKHYTGRQRVLTTSAITTSASKQ